MKQHNHWKLKQLLKVSSKVVLWVLGIVLVLLGYIIPEKPNMDIVSTVIGWIVIIYSAILYFTENFWWKTKIMTIPFLEEYWTPVLEGRWKGILIRDNQSHDFVLEIKQNFTSISCITYSKHSSSSSYAAEILYDEQLKVYRLLYYWQAKTSSAQANTGDTNVFSGLTVLNIIINNGKVTKLKGSYFTDRQPKQTKGTLELTFDKKELMNSFD